VDCEDITKHTVWATGLQDLVTSDAERMRKERCLDQGRKGVIIMEVINNVECGLC
jgi:hypothetical protein